MSVRGSLSLGLGENSKWKCSAVGLIQDWGVDRSSRISRPILVVLHKYYFALLCFGLPYILAVLSPYPFGGGSTNFAQYSMLLPWYHSHLPYFIKSYYTVRWCFFGIPTFVRWQNMPLACKCKLGRSPSCLNLFKSSSGDMFNQASHTFLPQSSFYSFNKHFFLIFQAVALVSKRHVQ